MNRLITGMTALLMPLSAFANDYVNPYEPDGSSDAGMIGFGVIVMIVLAISTDNGVSIRKRLPQLAGLGLFFWFSYYYPMLLTIVCGLIAVSAFIAIVLNL